MPLSLAAIRDFLVLFVQREPSYSEAPSEAGHVTWKFLPRIPLDALHFLRPHEN